MRGIQRLVVLLGLLGGCMVTQAQTFYNLTAEQLKIDSLLPTFNKSWDLGEHYSDSVYRVAIEYPEFRNMNKTDIARYRKITKELPPTMPVLDQRIAVSKKEGSLDVSFIPIVYRNGRYQKVVSFHLAKYAQAVTPSRRGARMTRGTSERYASNSVLAEGSWAVIRVPETGIYRLSSDLIRKAGFSNLDKVKIYGYGGARQPELLTADYLMKTDDLQEVPTITVNGRRLFYGVGPVGWGSSKTMERTRNPYSNYGYYLLTENEEEALQVDSTTFAQSFYPSGHDYHALYEVDNYSWYHGGSNLNDGELLQQGVAKDYVMNTHASTGRLGINLSFNGNFSATIAVNGTEIGNITATGVHIDSYSKAASRMWTFDLAEELTPTTTVTITKTSGSDVRLDYISLQLDKAKEMPYLSTVPFSEPEYAYRITNQNHHADEPVDMVIIIPAHQQTKAAAERLKALHETYDHLTVRIVPADELYNEFSSGTSDANAYRRYMKMLYDRAEKGKEPRFLLLFGDGAWDNRMLTSDWKNENPFDYLLCYESENSFSSANCYVTDDYFCLLDDNEGANILREKGDIAVGRLSARTAAQASTLVDKIEDYLLNKHAGAWQNTICVMGDDGNNNTHMREADEMVTLVRDEHPAFVFNKIYWDAYNRVTTSTGNTYPDVTKLIRQEMANGALVMNYTGHGAAYMLSHESVVKLNDFNISSSMRLPLWMTASCDVMPFDGQEENIGETAMMNATGGSIAFYGTTRTVYSNYNSYMNKAFMHFLLANNEEGELNTIGEAVRKAKNRLISGGSDLGIGTDLTTNKLQYTLLGDPALKLAMPQLQVKIDEINGVPTSSGEEIQMSAGQIANMKGHVEGAADFQGTVHLLIQDAEEMITCKLNDTSTDGAQTPFKYLDRTTKIYQGIDSVRNGQFDVRFAVPRDISYSDGSALATAYVVSEDQTLSGHGNEGHFVMNGTEEVYNDSIGPAIYCYLNTPAFVNGGTVNTTPYFYAELRDDDGINVSGGAIGHDLELIIDGDFSKTYNLNDYFSYDFGDYRRGTVGFSIPTLEVGRHKLLFRAWDVLNNSSTAELDFNVDTGLEPHILDVSCTRNPATNYTTFIISHDRAGSNLDVQLQIFDMSGRMLWVHEESGVSSGSTYTINWNLQMSGGRRIQTGVYLFRVLISNDDSSQASKAKKLIVVGNN